MNSVSYCLQTLSGESKLRRMEGYIQHGDTTCLKHTIAVAYYSIMLADFMGIRYSKRELVRGALLHDYFLYDWHIGGGCFHGFTHPSRALSNAERDFTLSETERDIIKKHMFPLTLAPPKYREGWIVCLVDKVCSVYETLKRRNAYSGISTKKENNYTELYEEIQKI